jgi:hypothetical protein
VPPGTGTGGCRFTGRARVRDVDSSEAIRAV